MLIAFVGIRWDKPLLVSKLVRVWVGKEQHLPLCWDADFSMKEKDEENMGLVSGVGLRSLVEENCVVLGCDVNAAVGDMDRIKVKIQITHIR